MILYGWNHYLLKPIQLHELGISAGSTDGMQIEYRQKYFHLFFIPVFPLGRFWAVRQHGTLYQPNDQLKTALQSQSVNTKKWIWSWTGILLCIAAFLFYNMQEKVNSLQYAKAKATTDKTLNDYFKDKDNTVLLAQKIEIINHLIDSTSNNAKYEDKKIDTSFSGIIKIFLGAKKSQKDSLSDYTKNNTAIFSIIKTKKETENLPSKEIEQAITGSAWKGWSSDAGSVLREVEKFREVKHLLLLSEYNRENPVHKSGSYESGISLLRGVLINIENGSIEHQFTVMAANSDSISHFKYVSKGESNSLTNYEWENMLNENLNQNAKAKAYQYVFHNPAKS